jgi:hypothetical protein
MNLFPLPSINSVNCRLCHQSVKSDLASTRFIFSLDLLPASILAMSPKGTYVFVKTVTSTCEYCHLG